MATKAIRKPALKEDPVGNNGFGAIYFAELFPWARHRIEGWEELERVARKACDAWARAVLTPKFDAPATEAFFATMEALRTVLEKHRERE